MARGDYDDMVTDDANRRLKRGNRRAVLFTLFFIILALIVLVVYLIANPDASVSVTSPEREKTETSSDFQENEDKRLFDFSDIRSQGNEEEEEHTSVSVNSDAPLSDDKAESSTRDESSDRGGEEENHAITEVNESSKEEAERVEDDSIFIPDISEESVIVIPLSIEDNVSIQEESVESGSSENSTSDSHPESRPNGEGSAEIPSDEKPERVEESSSSLSFIPSDSSVSDSDISAVFVPDSYSLSLSSSGIVEINPVTEDIPSLSSTDIIDDTSSEIIVEENPFLVVLPQKNDEEATHSLSAFDEENSEREINSAEEEKTSEDIVRESIENPVGERDEGEEDSIQMSDGAMEIEEEQEQIDSFGTSLEAEKAIEEEIGNPLFLIDSEKIVSESNSEIIDNALIIKGKSGSAVRAAFSGTVTSLGRENGVKYVIVTSSDGTAIRYSGFERVVVKAKNKVKEGTVLGSIGSSMDSVLRLSFIPAE